MEAAQYRQLHRAEWDAAQAEDFLFTLPCHVKWSAMDTQVGQLCAACERRLLGKRYVQWTAPAVAPLPSPLLVGGCGVSTGRLPLLYPPAQPCHALHLCPT